MLGGRVAREGLYASANEKYRIDDGFWNKVITDIVFFMFYFFLPILRVHRISEFKWQLNFTFVPYYIVQYNIRQADLLEKLSFPLPW